MTISTCLTTNHAIVMGTDSRITTASGNHQDEKLWLLNNQIAAQSFGGAVVNVPMMMRQFTPQSNSIAAVAAQLNQHFHGNTSMELVVAGYENGQPHVVYVPVGQVPQCLNRWPGPIHHGLWIHSRSQALAPFSLVTDYANMATGDAVAMTEECIRSAAVAQPTIALPTRTLVLTSP